MAVTSHVVARFGFQPTFCHFDTYTRSAKFDYERLEYRPVDGAESLQWRPGRASEKRKEGTPEAKLASTDITKIVADRPVPDQHHVGIKRTGVRPGHWVYIFAAKGGGKQADWYAELFAVDGITTALNPETTRAKRLSWAPPEAGAKAEQPKNEQSPPANVNYALNGRDTFITAIAVPYRLSDACLDVLEAELLELGDFVHVSRQLQSFAADDGTKSPLQWLEVPVLHPWAVAENLANGIREARSRHSRRNGMPGENPGGFSKPPLEPKQAETESCKQYALVSALVALMKGSTDLEAEISKRFTKGPELLGAKRALKTRPYQQLRFHVEAELLGADLAGWLSRRLVRLLMDGYIIPPGPTSTPELETLLKSLALASAALKHTSTGLEFLRVLRSSDWRGTLLGAIAAPSDPSMQEQHEQVRPYVDAVLAIGAVAISARVLLEGAKSFDIASELEALFGLTFEGDWKKSLDVRKKVISHYAFWGAGFDPKPAASHVLLRARRLQLNADTTARLERLAAGADAVLKVLDAVNLVVAIWELHEISESNPKLRNDNVADAVFQSLDLVKAVLEFALKDEKGLVAMAPRLLGTVLAARTAWKSAATAQQALSYGDINAFAAMAVTTVTSVLAIGMAAIGQAGAAAGHFGAIVTGIGVLASLVYVWAKDTELETFVAHSAIGDRAFERLDIGEPGWATVPLNKLASSWDNQLEALAALQGQFSLYTDATMHHQGTALNNVRLRPGILGSASRFTATWMWKAFGDSPATPMHTKVVHIDGAEGMQRDDDGLYIDLIIPKEAYDKASDAGKPIPPQLQLSVVREVYASEGVEVTLPLHGPAVMDCVRVQKSASEKIRSMDIVRPTP